MPSVEVAAFQKQLCENLRASFGGKPVRTEWGALYGESGSYSPRLDVAVGPFATGNQVCTADYDQLFTSHHETIAPLWTAHCLNVQRHDSGAEVPSYGRLKVLNPNARCFMAIEIENKVSRKHLMGGAINTAALGRIGVSIGWDEGKTEALVKLRHYLLFLARVGKNSFDPGNLLILSRAQCDEVMKTWSAASPRSPDH